VLGFIYYTNEVGTWSASKCVYIYILKTLLTIHFEALLKNRFCIVFMDCCSNLIQSLEDFVTQFKYILVLGEEEERKTEVGLPFCLSKN